MYWVLVWGLKLTEDSINPHNKPTGSVLLLSPLNRWKKWGWLCSGRPSQSWCSYCPCHSASPEQNRPDFLNVQWTAFPWLRGNQPALGQLQPLNSTAWTWSHPTPQPTCTKQPELMAVSGRLDLVTSPRHFPTWTPSNPHPCESWLPFECSLNFYFYCYSQ